MSLQPFFDWGTLYLRGYQTGSRTPRAIGSGDEFSRGITLLMQIDQYHADRAVVPRIIRFGTERCMNRIVWISTERTVGVLGRRLVAQDDDNFSFGIDVPIVIIAILFYGDAIAGENDVGF